MVNKMNFNNNNFSNDPFKTNNNAPLSFTGNSNTPKNDNPFAINNNILTSGFNTNNTPQFDINTKPLGNRTGDLSVGAIRSVRVISCDFCLMVEQAPMGFRPFISKVNDTDVLEQLPNFVRENRYGAAFRSESLNSIVNDIISISANSTGNIPLINGWDIKRYSFAIMAEVVRSTGNSQNYLIEGFTDTPNISASSDGSNVFVDPQMVLFVNNVVSFGERTNTYNGVKSLVPIDSFNIINKDPFEKGTQVNQLVTQRPFDVANMAISGTLSGNSSKLVLDSRSSVATEAKTSRLSNNNPSTYVAKILNDSISAIDSSNTDNIFNSTTIRNMIDQVREPSLGQNGFLQQLGRVNHDYPTAVSSFEWKDLTQLDPSLSNPGCQYLTLRDASTRARHLPTNGLVCEDINGSGPEQMFAASIANSVSDLMAQCRATEVSLSATNHGGVDDIKCTGMLCYDRNEIIVQSQLMERMFAANVVQLLNYNCNYSYNIVVQSYLWGETFVKINLGYGSYTFLFPNFANSMYSPMLTNSRGGTEDISRHLLSVANLVNEEQHKSMHSLRKDSNSVI